jgi:hypothetical protein
MRRFISCGESPSFSTYRRLPRTALIVFGKGPCSGFSVRHPEGGNVQGSWSSVSSVALRRMPITWPRRNASATMWSTLDRGVLSTDARYCHWSRYGKNESSKKMLLWPCFHDPPCRGSAIRLPNPPFGIVSWFGKNRSYESSPIACRPSMARVSIALPSFRAVDACIASSKKIQTCPPRPERDRSRAAATPRSRHAWIYARTSSCQPSLSKSAARNQHVSSCRSGYTPIVCLPKILSWIVSSDTGMYLAF